MKNFTYAISTVVHFGKGQIEKLGGEVAARASRVLMVYGGGSIKRNGVYDGAAAQLREHGIQWIELGGVEPNPRITTVRKGVELCRQNGLDGVLALGGGSVIDCAKAIAAGALYDGDPWDFPAGRAVPPEGPAHLHRADHGRHRLGDGRRGRDLRPGFPRETGLLRGGLPAAVSILDPTYTTSLPAAQTAAGTADIMSHTFENYFSPITSSYLADSMAEAILRACIHYGPQALAEPEDYEAGPT